MSERRLEGYTFVACGKRFSWALRSSTAVRRRYTEGRIRRHQRRCSACKNISAAFRAYLRAALERFDVDQPYGMGFGPLFREPIRYIEGKT